MRGGEGEGVIAHTQVQTLSHAAQAHTCVCPTLAIALTDYRFQV